MHLSHQQDHLTNVSLSRAVQQLRQELVVLKQQLVEEKETSRELRVAYEELEQEHQALLDCQRQGRDCRREVHAQPISLRDDVRSRWVDDADDDADAVPRGQAPFADDPPPPLGSVFRASQAMPIRYVPPVDFLPALFVEQYADVLVIVDRYAQLYHRYHVGGGQKDPSLTLHEPEAERSTRELLEARVKALESDVAAKDDTIMSLKEQLIAWRATGHERSRYGGAHRQPSPRWGSGRLGGEAAHNDADGLEHDDGGTDSNDDTGIPTRLQRGGGDDAGAMRRHRRASPRQDGRRRNRGDESVRPVAGRGDEEANRTHDDAPRRNEAASLSPTAAPPTASAPPQNDGINGSTRLDRALPTAAGGGPVRDQHSSAGRPAMASQMPAPTVSAQEALQPASKGWAPPDLMALYAPPRSLFSEASLPAPPRRDAPSSAANANDVPADRAAPPRHPWERLTAV